MGRFLNADGYISTGQGLLGSNMFAYCHNNPINLCDIYGESISAATILTALGTVAIGLGILALAHCITSAAVSLINALTTTTASLAKAAPDATEETLPRQGSVTQDPDAPPVDAGKQGKHVPGHNNYDPKKSSWPEGQTGVQQTQEAWKNGSPDPKKPDGSVRIGIASDGTTVRVHQGTKGWIHGYPISIIGVVVEVCRNVLVNESANRFLEVGWD